MRSTACSCRSSSSRERWVESVAGLVPAGLEFGRESVRLRPTDSITAHDFLLAIQDTVSMLSDSGRKDEAIAELRRSVKTLGEMASGNADTPKNQEIYLEISRNLADQLIEFE